MEFLCYSKCSTCQKAKKWLDENGIKYVERPIKEQNSGVFGNKVKLKKPI